MTSMEYTTMQHLSSYARNTVWPSEVDAFIEFAQDVLSDPDELEYYETEGWRKLFERYLDEIAP